MEKHLFNEQMVVDRLMETFDFDKAHAVLVLYNDPCPALDAVNTVEKLRAAVEKRIREVYFLASMNEFNSDCGIGGFGITVRYRKASLYRYGTFYIELKIDSRSFMPFLDEELFAAEEIENI